MGEFSPWHLLIVAAVFVLLFGARRLPDAARSLGKSARILKTELKDLHEDDKDNPANPAAMQQTAQLPAAPVPPPAVVAPPAPVVAEAPQTVASGDQTPAP
jgi:sec-independent protein translocase protein TatA